jgi:vitamin B12 transporter
LRAFAVYPVRLFTALFLLSFASVLPAQEGGVFPGLEGPEEEYIPMEAEGLTVVASPETTQQIRVISREEIAAAGAPDLGVLLQETMNLGTVRYGPYGNQTDISLRGFDSERIAFLINGVPANSPLSGDFDLSMIGLDSVDRIEVIQGGSDSKYNVTGALGGVINIITVREEERGFRAGASLSNTAALPGEYYKPGEGNQGARWEDLGDAQNITLSLGFGGEKHSWSAGLFANRAGNHFLYRDYYGRTLRREGNEVWDLGASLSLVRSLGEKASLIAGGDLYYGDKNIPLSGISVRAAAQRDFSTRQNLMLDMPALREDLAAEASLSHSWQSLNYGSASRHGINSVTAINRWTWQPPRGPVLSLGWDYRYNLVDSTDTGRRDRHDGGLYLSAEYQPLGEILIIPSVKAVFGGSAAAAVTAVPKLGFLWTPAPSFSLKNNYFRSFKLPDFEDLYWSGGGMGGNPDLKPEDGWGLDLGASWKPAEGISLEGTFFTQWTLDSIHWYASGRNWRPENVGKAVFFGLDIGPGFEIPLGGKAGPFEKILLSFSYRPLLSYLLSYGFDYSSDKRIPYMPIHSGGFSVTVPWRAGPSRGPESWRPAGSLRVFGHYQGLRYADTANLSKLRPYFLLNAGLTQEIGPRLSAFLTLRNLLNQSYESFNDYYMPGFTATLGLRMNFR